MVSPRFGGVAALTGGETGDVEAGRARVGSRDFYFSGPEAMAARLAEPGDHREVGERGARWEDAHARKLSVIIRAYNMYEKEENRSLLYTNTYRFISYREMRPCKSTVSSDHVYIICQEKEKWEEEVYRSFDATTGDLVELEKWAFRALFGSEMRGTSGRSRRSRRSSRRAAARKAFCPFNCRWWSTRMCPRK